MNCDTIDSTVGSRLDREAVLCTDDSPVYQRYTRIRGIVHEPVNLAQGIRVRRPAFHVQNVNVYHSRWKGWMDRFHGVATRYLDNYLGWYRMFDANRDDLSPHRILAAAFGQPYPHSTMTHSPFHDGMGLMYPFDVSESSRQLVPIVTNMRFSPWTNQIEVEDG